MSIETQFYLAKKFYPHLYVAYGVLCVRASLKSHGIPYDDRAVYAAGFEGF